MLPLLASIIANRLLILTGVNMGQAYLTLTEPNSVRARWEKSLQHLWYIVIKFALQRLYDSGLLDILCRLATLL